jgi:hypothetical protein
MSLAITSWAHSLNELAAASESANRICLTNGSASIVSTMSQTLRIGERFSYSPREAVTSIDKLADELGLDKGVCPTTVARLNSIVQKCGNRGLECREVRAVHAVVESLIGTFTLRSSQAFSGLSPVKIGVLIIPHHPMCPFDCVRDGSGIAATLTDAADYLFPPVPA